MRANVHSPVCSFPRFVIAIYIVFISAMIFLPLNLYSAVQMNEFQIIIFFYAVIHKVSGRFARRSVRPITVRPSQFARSVFVVL